MFQLHDPCHREGYRRSLLLCAIIAVALTAVACGPHGYPTTPEDQTNVLSTMVYQRHANGLCFGMVNFPVHGGTVVTFTHVPDSACAPAEAKPQAQYSPPGNLTLVKQAMTWNGTNAVQFTKPIAVWNPTEKTITISESFPADGLICIESSVLGAKPLCGLVREWERWGASK